MNMYFIALVLPDSINQKLLVYKRMMHEKYGAGVGLKSPAHITLIPPCWLDPGKENELIAEIDTLSAGIKDFKICSDNFSAFKPRTIFIAVGKNESLEKLKKTTDGFFSS